MSKTKEAEAPAKILKYMVDQNRPYSAVDIFTNLHKEFGKTCVQRTLDQLIGEGKLKEKVYGKQKVYVADQSQFPDVDEKQLKEMDQRMVQLQDKLKQSQTHCRERESQLSALSSSLTTQEAKAQLQALGTECSEMETRLKKIKEGKDSVSPEESQKIQKANGEAVRQWRKRKRMTTDIVNAILEGYPKSKKELYDDVGIETDEDYGVVVPS